MTRFNISKGLTIDAAGRPKQVITDETSTLRTALVGADLLGHRPAFEVQQGDTVATGDVLFRSRQHPEIVFPAPRAGKVATIEFGPRRTLSAIVIESSAEPGDAEKPPVAQNASTSGEVRALLLERGIWPAFRTRPFGYIPAPDQEPFAIVVNAVSRSLLAPDPRVVIDARPDDFREGLAGIALLTGGRVFLCRGEGNDLLPTPLDGVSEAVFAGTSASGFDGTQINRLCRAGARRTVWSVRYQDAIAIGHLLRTGQYLSERIVSVTGPHAARPRLLRTAVGADLQQIAEREPGASPHSILSGDALTGREAAYLGRYHDQITLAEPMGANRKPNRLRSLLVRRSAVVPTSNLERAMAIDVHPVPLMRALSVGDVDAAERLGCLELIEEDVAALGQLCTSGADYGRLLREVLDQLAAEAA